eukprot:TRINITY_DN11981_c0_g1_i2.p1 TRINITY_DN11981_c0_g1~~TRINITY_DN11981_c0_g1_i2.p1  ORF type:complete len:109 (+),score=3.39 TRINITY_DN11981_c0_g1_i2:348-674(+)
MWMRSQLQVLFLNAPVQSSNARLCLATRKKRACRDATKSTMALAQAVQCPGRSDSSTCYTEGVGHVCLDFPQALRACKHTQMSSNSNSVYMLLTCIPFLDRLRESSGG